MNIIYRAAQCGYKSAMNNSHINYFTGFDSTLFNRSNLYLPGYKVDAMSTM